MRNIITILLVTLDLFIVAFIVSIWPTINYAEPQVGSAWTCAVYRRSGEPMVWLVEETFDELYKKYPNDAEMYCRGGKHL